MFPVALGSLLGGAAGGGGFQSPTSSAAAHDSGLENSVSTNIVGNFNANLGEILQQLNQGSIVNGGFPTIVSAAHHPPLGMGGYVGSNLTAGNGQFLAGNSWLLIAAAAGIGLFFFMRR